MEGGGGKCGREGRKEEGGGEGERGREGAKEGRREGGKEGGRWEGGGGEGGIKLKEAIRESYQPKPTNLIG